MWGDVVFGLLASFENKAPPRGESADFYVLKIEIFYLRFQRDQKISKTLIPARMVDPNVPPGQGKKYGHFRATTKFRITFTGMALALTLVNQSQCLNSIWLPLITAVLPGPKNPILISKWAHRDSRQRAVHLKYCCLEQLTADKTGLDQPNSFHSGFPNSPDPNSHWEPWLLKVGRLLVELWAAEVAQTVPKLEIFAVDNHLTLLADIASG